MEEVRVEQEELKRVCKEILLELGQQEEYAEIVSDAVVKADLRGVKTHGTFRFPYYIERLEVGGTKVNPELEVENETPACTVLNAGDGLGQIGAYKGMEMAIKKAEDLGIGITVINGSCHFGIAAYYAMQALEKDMIGVCWSNGHAIMAPWGGSERKICNNPLSVAIPAGEYDPIVLDMAMSRVAGGKVRLAATKGESIPEDWMLDKDGKPTEDPEDLFAGGSLMAMGHKGYGLAIVGEVLSAALSGAGLLSQVPVWFKKPEEPTNTGHMVMAIDVSKFRDLEEFKEDVDHIISKLKASELAEGYEEILMPGEPEFRTVKKQLKEKISLPKKVIDDLNEVADKYNVAGI